MTVRCIGSLIAGLVTILTIDAAAAKDWSGLSGRVGYAFGNGDFTLTHEHEVLPLGTILRVSTEGELNMVGVAYRWKLGNRLYAGAKVDFYNGDLVGQRSHNYHGLESSFNFRTTLTGTVGGQLSYAFGVRERLLGYVGAGAAASKANIHAAAAYEDFVVVKDWDGGALGPYFELGANYAFSDKVSGFVEVKKFFYEVSDSCSIEGYDCGRATASTKPVVLTVGLEIAF